MARRSRNRRRADRIHGPAQESAYAGRSVQLTLAIFKMGVAGDEMVEGRMEE